MTRRFVFLVAAAGAVALAACSDDDGPAPNQAPLVEFLARPDSGAVVGEQVLFRWTGTDPDGSIDRYQTSFDSETEFQDTADTTAVLNFTKADGSDADPMPHVFRVRAVDDRGLAGPARAASFTVAVFNDPPRVAFTQAPPTGEYAGALVTFGWRGTDTDGTVAAYEVVFDDTLAAWTPVADTTLTVDFSSDTPVFPKPAGPVPAHMPHEYTFFVRAVDDEDKRSLPAGVTFLAGPQNVPPVVTLVSAPPLPENGTVTGQATWTWTAQDPDGAVTLTQYAVDLASPAGWKRWDAATLTLTFTRADGKAEDPRIHTFHLRAQDDDGLFTVPVTRDFRVGVPNQPPTVMFTARPDSTATVNYYFTYGWSAVDDEMVAAYEYAVDDTAGAWTSTTETSRQIVFGAADVVTASCNPTAGCNAFGDHVLYLRAVDNLGLRSAVLRSPLHVFNRTPVSTITSPTGPGGEVAGTASFEVAWQGTDLGARPGQVLRYSVLAREVDDFADHPDATAAVTEPGLPWTDVAAGATQAVVALEAGKKYLVAVRALDEAAAHESLFGYGKNVLKVTVP